MCTKNSYTKRDADAILKSAGKKKQYRKEKRAYYCSQCNGWHLTSAMYGENDWGNIELKQKDEWQKLL